MKFVLLSLLISGYNYYQPPICALDNKTLTEKLFNNDTETILHCKILSYKVDELYLHQYTADSIKISNVNFSGIPAFAKAEVLSVYFGNIDTSTILLQTHSSLTVGDEYLVYTKNVENNFYCGGPCDKWTKKIDRFEQAVLNEIDLLQQFSIIKNQRKSGKYLFQNKDKIVIAKGKFKNGVPIKIWKHFYDNGQLKSVYDFSNKNLKLYKVNGEISYNGTF